MTYTTTPTIKATNAAITMEKRTHMCTHVLLLQRRLRWSKDLSRGHARLFGRIGVVGVVIGIESSFSDAYEMGASS